jgi:hypothetical protein
VILKEVLEGIGKAYKAVAGVEIVNTKPRRHKELLTV